MPSTSEELASPRPSIPSRVTSAAGVASAATLGLLCVLAWLDRLDWAVGWVLAYIAIFSVTAYVLLRSRLWLPMYTAIGLLAAERLPAFGQLLGDLTTADGRSTSASISVLTSNVEANVLWSVVALLATQVAIYGLDRTGQWPTVKSKLLLAPRFLNNLNLLNRISAEPGSAAVVGNNATITLTNHHSTHDFTREISRAEDDRVAGREVQAYEALMRIESEHCSELNPEQMCDLAEQLAILNSRRDDPRAAAEWWTKAASSTNEEKRRLYLEATAQRVRELAGLASTESIPFVERAKAFCGAFPNSHGAAQLQVELDSSERPASEVLNSISAEYRSSVQVLGAAFERAERRGDVDGMRTVAGLLERHHPDIVLTKEASVRAVIRMCEHRYGGQWEPSFLPDDDASALRKAEAQLSQLYNERAGGYFPNRKADILALRGLVRDFLGNGSGAMSDWSDAAHTSSDLDSHVAPFCIRLLNQGGYRSVIEIVDGRPEKNASLPLATLRSAAYRELAVAEPENAVELRKKGAEQLAADLRFDLSDPSPDFVTALCELRAAESHTEVAPEDRQFAQIIEELGGRLPAVLQPLLEVLDAAIELEQSDEEDDSRQPVERRVYGVLLSELTSEIESDGRPELRLRCGAELFDAGLLFEAADVWLPAVGDYQRLNCLRPLLKCLRETHRDAEALRVCKGVREQGVVADPALELEAGLCARYGLDTRIDEVYDFASDRVPEQLKRRIRFAKARAALMVGDVATCAFDLSELPSVEELEGQEFSDWFHIARLSDGFDTAAGLDRVTKTLYELVVRESSNSRYASVFSAAMLIAEQEKILPKHDRVAVGTTVTLRTENGGERMITIVRDGFSPRDRQVAADSSVARELLGKSVGDHLIRSQQMMGTSSETITAIDDARVTLQREVLDAKASNDDDDFILKAFVVRDEDSPELLSKILGAYQSVWDAGTERSLDHFRSSPIPLPLRLLKGDSGQSYLQPYAYGFTTNSIRPHVVSSGPGRFIARDDVVRGRQVAKAASQFVLSSSAAATLWLTRAFRLIVDPSRILVPRSVLHLAWIDILNDWGIPDEKMTLYTRGQTAFPHVTPIETVARDRWRIAQFFFWLRDECTVIDDLAVASVPPMTRHRMVELLTFAEVSAIANASDRGIPLWSDEAFDVVVPQVLEAELRFTRTWTQAVIDAEVEAGRLSELDHRQLTVRLHASGGDGLRLDVRHLIAEAKDHQWDPRAASLQALVRWFANPLTDRGTVCGTLGAVIREVHSDSGFDFAYPHGSVTDAVLSAVLRRPDGETIIEYLKERLHKLFPHDPIKRRRVAEDLTDRLATRRSLSA